MRRKLVDTVRLFSWQQREDSVLTGWPRAHAQKTKRCCTMPSLTHPSQYYLSGLLTAAGCPYWVLVASLAIIAERVFNVFDATRAGLVVSLATAALGPLIEVRVPDLTIPTPRRDEKQDKHARKTLDRFADFSFWRSYVPARVFDAST